MFNDKELKLLKTLNLDLNFDFLSEEDLNLIEDVVSDYLPSCFDDDCHISSEGLVCESILDKLNKE